VACHGDVAEQSDLIHDLTLQIVNEALAQIAIWNSGGLNLSIAVNISPLILNGTGYSSLLRLARIPFTELKIDRSFVHGAAQREASRVILRSALELAGQLGLATVAEGVEAEDDWHLLQQFGCTFAQGWLIAKPLAAAEFLPWLESYRTASRHAFSKAAAARDGISDQVGCKE